MRVLMIGPGAPNESNSGLGVAAYHIGQKLAKQVTLTIVQPTEADSIIEKALSTKNIEHIKSEKFADAKIVQDLVQLNIRANINPYFYPYFDQDEKTIEAHVSEVKQEWQNFTNEVVEASKTLDFDVIYAHDWTTFEAGMLLKSLTNKPLVLHIHSLDVDRISSQSRSWIYELEQRAIKTADAIIAVSNYTANIIANQYKGDAEKVHTVYHGHEPLSLVEPKNIFKEPVVLFVGRLTNQKGPSFFLDIAEKVLSKRKETRFLMVGNGELMGDLVETAAHKGISDRFHFTGFIAPDKMNEIFARSAVYCLPSISEPFGLSAIEAADAKLPVVLTEQSGVAEVLTAALTANYGDVEGMANALISLLDNQELAEKVVAENRKAVQVLSWEKTTQKIVNIFESLIK